MIGSSSVGGGVGGDGEEMVEDEENDHLLRLTSCFRWQNSNITVVTNPTDGMKKPCRRRLRPPPPFCRGGKGLKGMLG